jgi:hypothetical protein
VYALFALSVDVAASYPSELGIPELKPNLLIFRNSLAVLNSFFQKAAEFAETAFVFAEKKGIRVLGLAENHKNEKCFRA